MRHRRRAMRPWGPDEGPGEATFATADETMLYVCQHVEVRQLGPAAREPERRLVAHPVSIAKTAMRDPSSSSGSSQLPNSQSRANENNASHEAKDKKDAPCAAPSMT